MEKQIIKVTSNFVSPEERTRLVRLCTSITGDVDAAEDLVAHLAPDAHQGHYYIWTSPLPSERDTLLCWLAPPV